MSAKKFAATLHYTGERGGRSWRWVKIIIMATVSLLVVLGGGVIWLTYVPELDARAEAAPIETEHVASSREVLLPAELSLAAGLAYDKVRGHYYISMDARHALFGDTTTGKVVAVGGDMRKLGELAISDSGDLEGIAFINAARLVVLADTGGIYWVDVANSSDGGVALSLAGSYDLRLGRSGLEGADHFKTNGLGSLAYDGKYLYTAWKEGEKWFYQFTLTGEVVKLFTVESFKKPRVFTVAGLTSHAGRLYVWSEAYSTLFVVNLANYKLMKGYGILGMNEASGVTTVDGREFYTVGDSESYIKEQYFYKFVLPSS